MEEQPGGLRKLEGLELFQHLFLQLRVSPQVPLGGAGWGQSRLVPSQAHVGWEGRLLPTALPRGEI